MPDGGDHCGRTAAQPVRQDPQARAAGAELGRTLASRRVDRRIGFGREPRHRRRRSDRQNRPMDADAIVVGAGLAGLAATHELTSLGKKVALVDQENAANLGGQAYWSFGGLFLVNSPEQRRMRVKDSVELAWSDWQGSAQFDRLEDEDSWAVRWARAYVEFASGEKRSGLTGLGLSFLPTVGWAERGDLRADGHGNSVPRFHVTWGTGTGVVEPFVRSALVAAKAGLVTFYHRHQVDELVVDGGARERGRCTELPDDRSV